MRWDGLMMIVVLAAVLSPPIALYVNIGLAKRKIGKWAGKTRRRLIAIEQVIRSMPL